MLHRAIIFLVPVFTMNFFACSMDDMSLLKDSTIKGVTTYHSVSTGPKKDENGALEKSKISDATWCGQGQDQVDELAGEGYYYVAMKNPECGRIYTVSIGGACEGGATNCKAVAFEKYTNFDSKKVKSLESNSIKLVVMDNCSECASNHFDIGSNAYLGAGKAVFDALYNQANMDSAKKNGFNPQDVNYFLKSVSKGECKDLSGYMKAGKGNAERKMCY